MLWCCLPRITKNCMQITVAWGRGRSPPPGAPQWCLVYRLGSRNQNPSPALKPSISPSKPINGAKEGTHTRTHTLLPKTEVTPKIRPRKEKISIQLSTSEAKLSRRPEINKLWKVLWGTQKPWKGSLQPNSSPPKGGGGTD